MSHVCNSYCSHLWIVDERIAIRDRESLDEKVQRLQNARNDFLKQRKEFLKKRLYK